MKAHWWSCVLGLLCMPAAANPTWTVSQNPLSISPVRVNSSAEIRCSTSLSDPMGLYVYRGFHGENAIVFLSLQNGLIIENTMAEEYKGRIHVTPDQQVRVGFGLTLRLSPLGLNDTDLYYCTWSHFRPQTAMRETKSSVGTIIIITDREPQEQCKYQILELILIFLSVTTLIALLLLLISVLIYRCKRFKKHFRPARAAKPPRPTSPQHVCPPHRFQNTSYLITSADTLDFRGIL